MKTLRQAYYEAVQNGDIPNDEKSYKIFASGWSAAVEASGLKASPPTGETIVIDCGSFEWPGKEHL